MRIITLLLFILLIQSCQFNQPIDGEPVVSKSKWNNNWSFTKDQTAPVPVQIPHTPRIEPLLVNDQWQGKHSYTKVLEVKAAEAAKTFIHFEGVMHEAVLYVNDVKTVEHLGGYLPFTADITNELIPGKNQLRLEVSNTDNSVIPPGKPLSGLDFNFYGGIYRDVWLIRKGNVYITDPFIENSKDAGWLIHFEEVSPDKAKGFVRVQVKNDSDKSTKAKVKVTLRNQDIRHKSSNSVTINPASTQVLELPIEVSSPKLWSTTNPQLYHIKVEVEAEGSLSDMIEDKVGIRKIELRKEGFYLNGVREFLRGTNRHQEYPYVGYAISNNANFRDALKIKNAGFDFVRLSHYPQDEAFLDACDELGILVMNAIPGWQYFEEGDFITNSYQDIRDMVRRDRNHPSIIFWEVSLNESAMTEEYMIAANEILKKELPFADTYSAGWIDHSSYDLYIPARQHGKPPHYWNEYKDGNRPVFIAEYGDWEYYAHNAGFNQTAYEDLSDEERNSRQLRAHGEKRLLQQAMNFQEAANSNRKGSGTIGHANWLMFDYNRGYADDLEASGISDIFRIPKFAYYFYKSQRPPYEDVQHELVEDGPMVKIASYWTGDSPSNVRVFSNCDEVALYLNELLISKQKPHIGLFSNALNHPPFEFDLTQFKPGTLKAVGFIGGKPVASDSVSTPGKAFALDIQIDSTGKIETEDSDLLFVFARIIDAQGNLIASATDEIAFDANDGATLIGENPIKAEAGIATVLVRGTLDEISIKASTTDGKLKSW